MVRTSFPVLGRKSTACFTDFDIQPVLLNKQSALDYFENKKMYFVKMLDGVVKGASVNP